MPLGADLKGAQDGHLIFTLRDDWTPEGGHAIRKGSLVAYRLAGAGKADEGSPVTVLFTPDAKSSIDEVVTGRDAVYASIYHDVTGSIHAFRPDAQGHWSDTVIPLPAGGSTHIVSVNEWGPQALLRYESYTVPTTLYADSGNGKPVAIKSLPRALRRQQHRDRAVLRDLRGRHARAVLRHAPEGSQGPGARPCCTAMAASRSR